MLRPPGLLSQRWVPVYIGYTSSGTCWQCRAGNLQQARGRGRAALRLRHALRWRFTDLASSHRCSSVSIKQRGQRQQTPHVCTAAASKDISPRRLSSGRSSTRTTQTQGRDAGAPVQPQDRRGSVQEWEQQPAQFLHMQNLPVVASSRRAAAGRRATTASRAASVHKAVPAEEEQSSVAANRQAHAAQQRPPAALQQPLAAASKARHRSQSPVEEEDDLEDGYSRELREGAVLPQEMLAAVRNVQEQLVAAVKVERQAEKDAAQRLYQRSSLSRLQADGMVLTGLATQVAGAMYSDVRWCLAPPRPRPRAGASDRAAPELPFHRFAQGDNVILSSQAGPDEASASAPDDGYWSVEGTLVEVKKTYVMVVIDRQLSWSMEELGAGRRLWRVDKGLKETTSRRQLQALARLEELATESRGEKLVRAVLLGLDRAPALAQQLTAWCSSAKWREDARQMLSSMTGLNDSQRAAIGRAMIQTFTLWQGPPGTGKTRTLLALVEVLCGVNAAPHRWAKMGTILACADTNAAVDNLVEGLLQRGIRVVRLGQPAKVRPTLRHSTLEALAEKTPQGQRAAAMRQHAAMLEEAAAAGGLKWQKMLQEDVVDMKRRAKLEWAAADRLINEASESVWATCQVVCCTHTGSGDGRLAGRVFRMVVIDEATQATEPATLIPLVRGAECVVMAGDQKQLPPTVISEEAKRMGLECTMFDRLIAAGLQPLLLDTQYRMHPALAAFPNTLFYAKQLKSGVSAEERPAPLGLAWPNPKAPVALLACEEAPECQSSSAHRSGASSEGDLSFYNLPEAQLALRVVSAVLSGGDVDSIAVLTPYQGQVRALNDIIRSVSPLLDTVTVSSVDGFQGREADVVVFTTVRCNDEGRLGFVTDPRRLNVAITRPRRGLVVVGSPSTLQHDRNWLRWLKWVSKHGLELSAGSVPASPWKVDAS